MIGTTVRTLRSIIFKEQIHTTMSMYEACKAQLPGSFFRIRLKEDTVY